MSTPTLTSRADEDRWIWKSFHHHSRTFSLAARLLPRAVQLPIATLYLFCRRVDTIADQRVLEVGADRALDEVHTLRRHLDATLAGTPPNDDLLWRRLVDVHERYQLDRGPLYELIDGATWDLEDRPVESLDDLVAYSNLVGGSVGAMMLPFLLSDPAQRAELEPHARSLGIAMQITNILRDVGEDLQRLSRVYLPLNWLDSHTLSPDDLTAPPLPDGYASLLEVTMEAAEARYKDSFAGVDALPFKMRVGIRSAARMYREIMNEVRALDYDNLNHRAYVTLGRKLRLVVHDDYARRKARLLARRR
jgi:phytoene synthase